MEAQSEDSGFSVTWLLGLGPRLAATSSLKGIRQHLGTDSTPKIGQQLGLQLHQDITPTEKQFTTREPYFTVSWLIGLEPNPFFSERPWAREFYSQDAKFMVSRILGLQPNPESEHTADITRKLQRGPHSADEASSLIEEDPVFERTFGLWQLFDGAEFDIEDQVFTYGLRLIFGPTNVDPEEEIVEETTEVDDEKTAEENEEPSVEDLLEPDEEPVLAEPEFLELCGKLEQFLVDIE